MEILRGLMKWDRGYGRVGIGAEGVGGVLVNLKNPSESEIKMQV